MSDDCQAVGENPERPGLQKTPLRAAKALMCLTAGYSTDMDQLLNEALFEVDTPGDLVVVSDIDFSSMCEHHLLPFTGKVCCH